MRDKREIRASRFKIAFSASLNREQKGLGLFVFHRLPSFLLSSYIVLGLFLSSCYQGGGKGNPFLGVLLPTDPSSDIIDGVPPPCEDTEIRGSGTWYDPYRICNPGLFLNVLYDPANNTSNTFFVLEQDLDMEGALMSPVSSDITAACGDPGSFRARIRSAAPGEPVRIINYRKDITTDERYNTDPSVRINDVFGACIANVIDIEVDPRSPEIELSGCGFFANTESGQTGLQTMVAGSGWHYIICSREQFLNIDSQPARRYTVWTDDLPEIDLENNPYTTAPINTDFTGTLRANGLKVLNLRIETAPGTDSVGLFSEVSGGIYDLHLEGLDITIENTTSNTFASTDPPLNQVGALAGRLTGRLENCSVIDRDEDADIKLFIVPRAGASVSSYDYYGAGGMVGSLDGASSRISNSYVEGLSIVRDLALDLLNPATGILMGGLAARLHGGEIRESYTHSVYLLDRALGNLMGSGYGGLVGGASSVPALIEDSYAYQPIIEVSGTMGNAGGLLGIYYGRLAYLSPSGSSGSLRIRNSYVLGGRITALRGSSMGGLIGSAQEMFIGGATRHSEIQNSFSTLSDFILSGTASDNSAIGGLHGRARRRVTTGSGNAEVHTVIQDSYYGGQILCSASVGNDGCGGLIGASERYVTTRAERSYSSAGITQDVDSGQDGIGLLFGHDTDMGSVIGTADIHSGLTALAPNSLYFLRDGIGMNNGDPFAVSTMNPIHSASQPCRNAVVMSGTPPMPMTQIVCPSLAVTMDAANRALTQAQFQAAPSGDGDSPNLLGGEFLYEAGWCPRVCRNGVSPCADETSLVGFDAAGQPLPGPGGGAIAQGHRQGSQCFASPTVEEPPSIAPLPVPARPPPAIYLFTTQCPYYPDLANGCFPCGGCPTHPNPSIDPTMIRSLPLADELCRLTYESLVGATERAAREMEDPDGATQVAAVLGRNSSSYPSFTAASRPVRRVLENVVIANRWADFYNPSMNIQNPIESGAGQLVLSGLSTTAFSPSGTCQDPTLTGTNTAFTSRAGIFIPSTGGIADWSTMIMRYETQGIETTLGNTGVVDRARLAERDAPVTGNDYTCGSRYSYNNVIYTRAALEALPAPIGNIPGTTTPLPAFTGGSMGTARRATDTSSVSAKAILCVAY